MADQILKVRIVATDDGFKTIVDSATTSLERVENAGRKFGSTLSSLSGLAAGLGVSLSAGYFAHLIKSTIDANDELNKLAQKTATTVEGLSALQYAAKLSGLNNEQLANGLEHLNKSMLDATVSTSTQARSFNALGIQTRTATGQLRPTEQVLLDLADAFAKSSDKGATVALAMNILGKSGADLIPLLNSGKSGLIAYMEAAKEAGVVVSKETAVAAEHFNDNLTKLNFSAQSLTIELVNELVPGLVRVTDSMVNAAKGGSLFNGVMAGLGQITKEFTIGDAAKQLEYFTQRYQDALDKVNANQGKSKSLAERLIPNIEGGQQYWQNKLEEYKKAVIAAQNEIYNYNPTISTKSNFGSDNLAGNFAPYNPEKDQEVLASRKAMLDLYKQAYPEAMQSAEQYGEVQKQEAQRWLVNQESAEAYGKRMADLAKQGWPDATQSAEEYGQAQADIAKKMLANAEAADQSVQIYKDTATSIRGAFRDTFLDIENNGISSFKNLGNRIFDVFKNMLADMATLAIARPVIIPLVTGLGSLLGVSGTAQASVIAQLGGAGAAGGLGAFGNFGTGISAGLAGGFTAAGQLGGLGATTAGAYLGAAAPYLAPLAVFYAANTLSGGSVRNRNLGLLTGVGTEAINKLLGGGLFGTGSKITGSGLQLNIGGGDVSGFNYTDTSRKKSFFRGTSNSTDYSAADASLLAGINSSIDTGMQQIIAGAAGLGVNTAQHILDGFASTTKLALQGKSQQEVQQAIQDWLDKTLGDMAKTVLLDSRYSGLVKGATKDMTDALISLGQFFQSNPLADAAEQMRVASRTILQQYQDQRDAVLKLARAYDGSTSSTQALATATQSAYNLELQLVQQIAGVRDTVGSTIGGSIEGIQTSVMKPDQLYSYYSGQAQRLAAQLGSAIDPSTIATLVDQINSYTNKAYGTIPGAAQGGVAPQFVQFLQGVQTTADQRLATIEQSITASHQDVSKTIQDTMAAVAARMDAAARAQEAAAKAAQEAAQAQRDAALQFYNYGHNVGGRY